MSILTKNVSEEISLKAEGKNWILKMQRKQGSNLDLAHNQESQKKKMKMMRKQMMRKRTSSVSGMSLRKQIRVDGVSRTNRRSEVYIENCDR